LTLLFNINPQIHTCDLTNSAVTTNADKANFLAT
jgi:hypothetical protein